MIQELLYKIKTPKIKKSKWTRRLSLLKYIVLSVFVIILPVYYLFWHNTPIPAFCKYICPAGTLQAGIPLVAANPALQEITGTLFNWKIFVLIAVIAASVFIYRFFCRFICPLGAIYSFFNRYALIGIGIDKSKCVKCKSCTNLCKLDTHQINDRECIRCGECRYLCKNDAIFFAPEITRKKEKPHEKEI
jgi:polyferredoxin